MAIERVRPLKLESVAEGGTQDDSAFGPTEVLPGQDYLDCQGVTYQRPNSNTSTYDARVNVTRTSVDDMTFTDPNAGALALQQLLTLVTGRPGSHNAVTGLEHWTGNPGDGFASGAVLSITQTGVLPTLLTWSASNASNANPLFQIAITYNGIRPVTITQRVYSAGSVVRTFVDTFTYANVFYPSVTRTWT